MTPTAHHVTVTIRSTVFVDGGTYDDYLVQHPHGSANGTVTQGFDPASTALRLLYPERGYRENARITEHAIFVSKPAAMPGLSTVKTFAAETHHFTIASPEW